MTFQVEPSQISDPVAKAGFRAVARDLVLSVGTQLLNTGGLAIGTGSTAKVKLVNTVYAVIDGVLVTKTTAEATLSGTVTNAAWNVYQIFLAADGTLTAVMGTEGSTLAAVQFPQHRPGEVSLGFVIIHPTGTGNFVGGTTALSDATVVPNAVYVNTVGAFNATLETSEY